MREHELDQMLSKERDVMPSARFTKSVMEAVRAEASAPPPLTFSWWRVLPLVATGIFTVAWVFIEGLGLYTVPQASPGVGTSWTDRIPALLFQIESFGIGWVLLALLITAACVELTWRACDRRA